MPEADSALAEQIRRRLDALAPLRLELEDQSAAHAGHAGARAGAHFGLTLVSPAFAGKSRIERHRMVHAQLAGLLPGRIHALTMRLLAPDEYAAGASGA